MKNPQRVYSPVDLGQVIRTRRKARGYTQAKVAAFAGCSTRFLSELERGKQTIELGKTIAVMDTLGLNLLVKTRGE